LEKNKEKDKLNEGADLKEICRLKISKLVNEKEVFFTKRCNKSIELAMAIANEQLIRTNEKSLLIQKEGGWITYQNYAKKYKLKLIRLDMIDGKIIELKNEGVELNDAILTMHSRPGYSYDEDMNKIRDMVCKKNIFLINDCCGSIGTGAATTGDLIVCSFGDAKPLSAGGGGFIAADKFTKEQRDKLLIAENEAEELINFKELNLAIDLLPKKLAMWKVKKEKIEKELLKDDFNILNVGEGINILVSFEDDIQKERLINYCKDKELEFVECPRYIRTMQRTISIEIKRLK